MIETKALTKDYGGGRGVFDLTLSVASGEVFGFLGPNGAGKTTTIRQLMGFISPDSGTCKIDGKDCFPFAKQLMKHIGYIPGELALMDEMTAENYLRFIAGLRGLRDETKKKALCERFALDTGGHIRKMSKGTKQKVGIIAAFMHDPELYILDEPTSGLDPLMQNEFINLLEEEKARGKTIFLSSHLFEEVERTCDRIAILRGGKLAAVDTAENLKKTRSKIYHLTFADTASATSFLEKFRAGTEDRAHLEGRMVSVHVRTSLNEMVTCAAGLPLLSLETKEQSLEEVFLQYYGGDRT